MPFAPAEVIVGRYRQRAAAAAALLLAAPALAGPPYLTDDPAPTAVGHWEIYGFAADTGFANGTEGAAGVDLNYGAAPGLQLTATLPVDFVTGTGGDGRLGLGDIEVGAKYRFVATPGGFSVAVFPRLIIPTGTHPDGLHVAGLLPVWAEQDWGPWSVFGGGGYTINPGAGNRDYGVAGLAVTRSLGDKLAIGGEFAWHGADAVGARSYGAVNFGAIVQLGGPFSLLVSGGPGVIHADAGGDYNLYAAIGLNF